MQSGLALRTPATANVDWPQRSRMPGMPFRAVTLASVQRVLTASRKFRVSTSSPHLRLLLSSLLLGSVVDLKCWPWYPLVFG